MLSLRDQRILIIAPHPDDEIFGCGGLIARCKREGGSVHVLFLTVGTTQDFSGKSPSTADQRMVEIDSVMGYLNVDSYRMAFPGNEYHLQLDALPQKKLIHEIERGEKISLQAIEPTMVLPPLPNDYNQDHRAAAQAMVTATRPVPPVHKPLQRIVGHYELPPSAWTERLDASTMNCFLELTEEDMERKIAALQLYPSQLKVQDGPLSVHGVRTLASMRGLQCGCAYAEAFALKRLLI